MTASVHRTKRIGRVEYPWFINPLPLTGVGVWRICGSPGLYGSSARACRRKN
jgi:hypothetical protein